MEKHLVNIDLFKNNPHISVIFSVSENIIGVLYAALKKKSIILIVKVVVIGSLLVDFNF